jgi:uncharacterized protein YjbI with pentapeptide repeats
MSNPPENFFHDRESLENWISHNPSVPIKGHGVRAPNADLTGLKLAGADFTAAHLEGARFDGSDLSGAVFRTTRLEGASLVDTRLAGANFELAKLDDATLEGATGTASLTLASARMKRLRASGLDLEGANLQSAYLEGADLRGANLSRANLIGVNLLRADLRDANLYAAHLTNTTWGEVRLNKATNLSMTVFRPEHDSPNDRSDELGLTRTQQTLSWTSIRFLGEIPLFGASYALLVATLVVVSGIQWLNLNPFVQSFQYPIPVPAPSRLLLLGSILLAVGATVFQIACPPRVREFSRVRWVEELGRSGARYSWEALQRPLAATICGLFVAGGGLLVGIVFVARLVSAVRFVVSTLA